MSISFSEVPNNARVPGVYIEIDNSLANSAQEQQRVLVIGNAIADAKTPPNTVVLCMNEDSARELFGESDITNMLKYFTKQNETLPIYAVSVESADTMSALAALGDTQYHHIVCSLNDETTVRELGEFLDARYKALEMIPAIAYLPKQGTHAELVTLDRKSVV